ncbi:MAG: ATP-binding protein [Patescibacteria group bacterium]|nr:ATP-binding protein [Patescibacteria group bacterium]
MKSKRIGNGVLKQLSILSMGKSWSRGSSWRRWDPHIHTPATLLSNQFKGNWGDYLTAIENASPAVEAIGITEYCLLTGYKEFKKKQQEGRATNIKFVFPNVEFRYDVQTEKKKGINIHLLFSPEDSKHVTEIENALARLAFTYKGRPYNCSETGLISLGRAYDPSQTDDHGALVCGVEQFKITLDQLRQLFKDDTWLKDNCLVAVDAGESDGTAGLQKDSSFNALRQEIEAFADVIFSPREADREYWLGKKPGFGRDVIEKTYRSLKPCLHGSDAHSQEMVLKPVQDRYCWVKADPTFTGLKQTLLEPDLRVWIGPEPPGGASASECMSGLAVSNAPWLKTPKMELNAGLVAIIGPKGSGKTALADMTAHGAGEIVSDEASFLVHAAEFFDNEEVKLDWEDGTSEHRRLSTRETEDREPRARYLSQKFVDRLCAAESVTDELIHEIETVVFHAIPDDSRFEATTFQSLRDLRLEQVHRQRQGKLSLIQRFTSGIALEDDKKARLPKLELKKKDQAEKIKKAEADLKRLLPKGKKEEVKKLDEVQVALEAKEKQFQAIKVKLAKLTELETDFAELQTSWVQSYEDLKGRYEVLDIKASEWVAFKPVINEGAGKILDAEKIRLSRLAKQLQEGAPGVTMKQNPATWPLNVLRRTQKDMTDAIGVEKERARKYADLQGKVADLKRELAACQKEIDDAMTSDARRKKAADDRRKAYENIFEYFIREREILEELYKPLQDQLAGSGVEQQRKLEFYVRRHVDIDAWVERGENLLDLRRSGAFQGRGKLAEAARAKLLPTWQSGSAEDAGAAVDSFIGEHKNDFTACLRPICRRQDIGEWLFSTEHISLIYGIKYDGVELSKLSPGTRGTVLLMLYLAIDKWDSRPLIVDQPEENLDPQSVYDELVTYFRVAKRRRQVVLVTHNPNLVVNTDADQVIVAGAERLGNKGLPHITYISGGLEDKDMRAAVCRILEGGERAFLDREKRYNLPRDYPATR